MEFGYFTLSDNRYPDNPRTPEQFVREIYRQALYAEEIGLNSAWIGEHHFNLLGVNPCPNILLAQLAGATKRIRLAPAVVLLPVHHPLHVAEEWATLDLLSGGRVDFAAGRGYDRLEYAPFGAPFQDSAEIFAEGLDILWRAWTEPGRWSHKGKYYAFDDIEVRPRPRSSRSGPTSPAFRGCRWSWPRATTGTSSSRLLPPPWSMAAWRRASPPSAKNAPATAARHAVPSAAISSTSPTPKPTRITAVPRCCAISRTR